MLELMVAVPGMVLDKEINQALHICAKKGLLSSIKIIIQAGADIDFTDSNGMSAILYAASSGHQDVVKELISAKCHMNKINTGGSTALHLACRYGRAECVNILLQNDVRKNTQDNSMKTALIHAAENRHATCLKYMISAGCDLDLQDHQGHTALHHACKKAVGVDLLLNAGANPDLQDEGGNTPLMVAATEGFDNIVISLVTVGCNSSISNHCGRAPVHYLAMKNHWKGIDAIAHAHGDINVVDRDNRLPLWYSVNHNRHHAVKTLLRANCIVDPMVTSVDDVATNNSPLHTALTKGLYGIAKLLVLAGCQLNPLYQWLHQYEENIRIREQESAERRHLWLDSDEDSDSSDDDNMEQEEAYHWFQDWIHKPHTLRQLCRISIRGYIGRGLLKKAEELPVPSQVMDYITLREVEDHPLEGDFI